MRKGLTEWRARLRGDVADVREAFRIGNGGLIFCSTPTVPPLTLPRRVAPCKKHGTDIRLPFSYCATALLIRCDRDHKALNVAVWPRPPNPAGFIEERANRSNRVRRSEPCTADRSSAAEEPVP
jgi:hypothetical protein